MADTTDDQLALEGEHGVWDKEEKSGCESRSCAPDFATQSDFLCTGYKRSDQNESAACTFVRVETITTQHDPFSENLSTDTQDKDHSPEITSARNGPTDKSGADDGSKPEKLTEAKTLLSFISEKQQHVSGEGRMNMRKSPAKMHHIHNAKDLESVRSETISVSQQKDTFNRSRHKNQYFANSKYRNIKVADSQIGGESSGKEKSDRHLYLQPDCPHCSVSILSGISYSSDDDFEDAEPAFEIVLPPEDLSGFNDWDSGLSTYSNNSSEDLDDAEWEDAISILENQGRDVSLEDMIRSIRNQELVPHYPHRALMFHECEVCLVSAHLRRRYCCDFKICNDCMRTYVTMKVSEAKVQIECPNDRCATLIHRDEINDRLSTEMKAKFAKFLVDANADPYKKTCPACSEIQSVDPKLLANKKKLKYGYRVSCEQCRLQWCFICQAPYHNDITCKQFRKGDEMVKRWAKERSYGQTNAQRCPKCKIFIQKVHGCDHMKCTRCSTDFCYRCGDRYISIKLLGNHWSRFSLFGCKYRLMPEKPALRRVIRGANFAARLVAGVILAGLGIACGAALVGASVVIVPGYGIFRLKRHLTRRKAMKRFERRIHQANIARRDQELKMLREAVTASHGASSANGEPEEGNLDTQQVQVIVHRSVSFSQEDEDTSASTSEDECEFYINKYTAEGTDVVVSAGMGNQESDDIIVVTDVKEIPNAGGYPTVVASIVSQVASEKDAVGKNRTGKKDRKVSNSDPPSVKAGNAEQKQCKENEDPVLRNVDKQLKGPDAISDSVDESSSSGNLSRNDKSDSGYDESENGSCQNCSSILTGDLGTGKKAGEMSPEQEITSPSDSGSKVSGVDTPDETDCTKSSSNGCFGNIFSKRNQAQIVSSDEATTKNQIASLQKKLLGCKAATWEKCRRDAVQSLLKSTPQDQTVDLSNLSVVMYGSKNEGKALGISSGTMIPNQKLSEAQMLMDGDLGVPTGDFNVYDISFGPDTERVGSDVDPEPRHHSEESVDTSQIEVLKPLSHKTQYGTLTEGCYISEYSAVTYL